MKFTSHLITAARGKLGDVVFSATGPINTLRAHAVAKQPGTPAQTKQKTTFGNVALAWGALTEGQRTGWASLAATVTLTNSLGTAFHPSGQQLFISCNTNLKLTSQAALSDAPASRPATPPLPSLTLSVTHDPQSNLPSDLVLTASAAYNSVPMILRGTKPQPWGRRFFDASHFRQVALLPDLVAGANPIGAQYAARFQALRLGTVVAVQLTPINSAGFAGQPVTLHIAI